MDFFKNLDHTEQLVIQKWDTGNFKITARNQEGLDAARICSPNFLDEEAKLALDDLRKKARPLVVYHDKCLDGFTAAWVAWKCYPEAEFYPHSYEQLFDPEICRGRTVFILDYSFKHRTMERIQAISSRLAILDHHKSAEQELAPMKPRPGDRFIFDKNRSGASLAWDYFFTGQPKPLLVQLVEDYDLWKFQHPETLTLHCYLNSFPPSFEQWERIYDSLKKTEERNGIMLDGAAIFRYRKQQLNRQVKHCREVEFCGYRIPAVNSTTMLSEVVGELAKGKPFAVGYWQDKNGLWHYSLRSDQQGMDVSEIAVQYGGGGHQHAAGFESKELLIK